MKVAMIVLAVLVALATEAAAWTPTLKCDKATTKSFDVVVGVDGAPGLPSGFQLEYLPEDVYKSNGHKFQKPCNLTFATAVPQGKTLTVTVGEGLKKFGNKCKGPDGCKKHLKCGTSYALRAFGYPYTANGKYYAKSPYSKVAVCSTKPCPVKGCFYTKKGWFHKPSWPLPHIKLGWKTYSRHECKSIFGQGNKDNGLLELAVQLAVAKLNLANGCVRPLFLTGLIIKAEILIGLNSIPPFGGGFLSWSLCADLASKLKDYNEGKWGGPGKCIDDDEVW